MEETNQLVDQLITFANNGMALAWAFMIHLIVPGWMVVECFHQTM